MQVSLRVPAGCDATSYHEDLKKKFIDAYSKKDDEMLQMSLHVIEPSVWHLQGRAKMHDEVHLRGARRRIRNMLMKCHERLGLPPEANLTFGIFLETALDVKPDAESFSGDRIS